MALVSQRGQKVGGRLLSGGRGKTTYWAGVQRSAPRRAACGADGLNTWLAVLLQCAVCWPSTLPLTMQGIYTPTDAPGICANCTIANCVQCTGATSDDAPTCATCIRGYNFITASNECLPCRVTGGDKCVSCAADGTGYCTKCWDRWSVDSSECGAALCCLFTVCKGIDG